MAGLALILHATTLRGDPRTHLKLTTKSEEQKMAVNYNVPGDKVVLAQPSTMACWATVYTMMKSWNDQLSYSIESAVENVAHKYGDYYRNNTGLPSSEFGPFLMAAGMTHEPMENLTIDGWLGQLQSNGLIWVGTLAGVSPGTGLHSRIIEGISGDGNFAGTWFSIIDPAGGKRYTETFSVFLTKYEGAFRGQSGEYFQIRHF
jgi:hypothetical protein